MIPLESSTLAKEAQQQHRSGTRARVNAFRIGVAVLCAAILWRAWPGKGANLAPVWQHPWYLAAAVLCRPAFTLLLALRLGLLARGALAGLAARDFVRIAFAGQTFNQFLPGGVGGDAVRATMLHRSDGNSWPRVSGVLLADRVLGLASIAGWMLAFGWPLVLARWRSAALVMAALVLGGIAFLAAGGSSRAGRWLQARPWARDLAGYFLAMSGRRLAVAAVIAVLAHGLLLASGAWTFDAVALPVPWPERIGALSVAYFLGALPLAIGGHGVREGALVMLLTQAVAGPAPLLAMNDAILVAVAILVIHLTTNLGGGLVAILVPPSRDRPAAQP
ncbi:MAG TPA: lysylphosphatidylglycerol synthase transmembrane domain-containing protein [Lacunisphaera sp.]|nr:lysylphosphatidylglycerol synthase transmembrane domain-containing protein [Lacunisphaera sp.]